MPAKPCKGQFSDETQRALMDDVDHARRTDHICQLCKMSVSARLEKGRWVPDMHWPSVRLKRLTYTAPVSRGHKRQYSRIDGSLLPGKSCSNIE